MAEPLQQSNATATATANPSAAAASSSRDNRDASAGTTSSSTSHVRQEEDASIHSQFQQPEHENNINFFGRFNWGFNDASSVIRDDSWSCIIVLFTFWFFVSLTLILGVYGSMNILLGPHSSILLQPNPLFVQYIKVEDLDESKSGAMLYGIYGSPALDVITNWAETLNVSVPSDSHKEWKYYLNKGSQLNISYSLGSASSFIFLIIAEGSEGLARWLENPTYPNTTLSWNIIRGTGMITQNIFTSSSYYVAVGNLNEEVEVELNFRVMAFTYNKTNAYYKCTLNSNPCGLGVFFPEGNAAVLATPGPEQNISSDGWYVKLSYGPRWITYILGMGGMTLLLFIVFNYINRLQCSYGDRAAVNEEPASERAPLLSYKDDDLSSWGSSCDSLSQDEDLDFLTGASADGKSPGDGESSSNTRRLCAICFDAPRDCFFLPCGHCVACFACGTRLAEADGTCPVCRRNMKKVRRIFTV